MFSHSFIPFFLALEAVAGLLALPSAMDIAPSATQTVTEVLDLNGGAKLLATWSPSPSSKTSPSASSSALPVAGFINKVPSEPQVFLGLIQKNPGPFKLITHSGRGVLTKRAMGDDKSFTDDGTFKKDVLNSTNTIRGRHNATTLSWNTTMATYAENYSKQCSSTPSATDKFGENIAFSNSTVDSAISSWVPSSLANLNFTLTNSGFGFTGPVNVDPGEFLVTLSKVPEFTQLVWKSSTDIGCGRTKCDGKWSVVCEFWPKGNNLAVVAANVQGVVSEQATKGSGSGVIQQSRAARWSGHCGIAALVVGAVFVVMF